MALKGNREIIEKLENPNKDFLRVYGDFMFLFMRSKVHARMPVAALRANVEPPIALGQFNVFRLSGVPRGLFTWAWLNEETEKQYLNDRYLDPNSWRSGDKLWIMDFVAPYPGVTKHMSKWIMEPDNLPARQYRFRRVDDNYKTRKILHVDLDTPDDKSRVFTLDTFLKDPA